MLVSIQKEVCIRCVLFYFFVSDCLISCICLIPHSASYQSYREDPFGNDITDLPLDNFCQAIEMQIAAVFADTFPPQPTYVGAWPTHKVPVVKKTVSKDYNTLNKDYTLNSTTPIPSSAATRHFNNSSTSIPQRSAMNISSATEPITTSDDNSPIEECFEDNISSGQLATILSGDCLSGSISSGAEQV